MDDGPAGSGAGQNQERPAAEYIYAGAGLAAADRQRLPGTDCKRVVQGDDSAAAAVRRQKEGIGGNIRAEADEIGAAALDDLQDVGTGGQCRAGTAVEGDGSEVDLIAGTEAADEQVRGNGGAADHQRPVGWNAHPAVQQDAGGQHQCPAVESGRA